MSCLDSMPRKSSEVLDEHLGKFIIIVPQYESLGANKASCQQRMGYVKQRFSNSQEPKNSFFAFTECVEDLPSGKYLHYHASELTRCSSIYHWKLLAQ